MSLTKIQLADQFIHHRLLIGVGRLGIVFQLREARERIFSALGWPMTLELAFSRKGVESPIDKEGNVIFPDATFNMSMTDIFEFVDREKILFDFFNMQLTNAVVILGDLMIQNKIFEITQETEFFRHLRNGAAHNNHFHFTKDEPRQLAAFKHFSITKALQGYQVFQTLSDDYYIGHGDVLDLMETIEGQFRL